MFGQSQQFVRNGASGDLFPLTLKPRGAYWYWVLFSVWTHQSLEMRVKFWLVVVSVDIKEYLLALVNIKVRKVTIEIKDIR